MRPDDVWKASRERLNNGRGVVHRQRGLRGPGEVVRVSWRQPLDVRDCFHQHHGAIGQLSDGAHNFRVALMADEHDGAAPAVMQLRLAMHLGDERACGVDGDEVAGLCVSGHGFGHAVG